MDGNRILDDLLRQLESRDESASLGMLDYLGRAWNALPFGVRRLLRPIRLKFGRQIFQSLTSGDRAGRQCFTIPTQDQCGGIRINLVGRETHGIIAPGLEYDAFTDNLIRDLYQLVDSRTGEKAVENIMRSIDLYEGNHVGDAADLILQWRIPSITSLESAKIGKINTVYGSRKGDHKPLGMFFAAGPGLNSGALEHAVSITDYAPTIANILGVELANVEGNVISELCPKA